MTRDTFKAKGTPPSAAQQQAQSDREVRAWETEDGRVISARQKETALRNGGASASSVANYNIPLYTTPPSVPVGVGTGLLRWVKAQADDPDANPRFRELYAALSQQPVMDGCHCGTCTCNPNMTPAVRFDLSPAQQEGAIREHLIRLGWTPPVDVKPLSEFMAEQEALHPGIHNKVQAVADELRESLTHQSAAVAAIQFALTDPEGMTFLRLWNEGEFDILRREWPEAPSEVYDGADPLA